MMEPPRGGRRSRVSQKHWHAEADDDVDLGPHEYLRKMALVTDSSGTESQWEGFMDETNEQGGIIGESDEELNLENWKPGNIGPDPLENGQAGTLTEKFLEQEPVRDLMQGPLDADYEYTKPKCEKCRKDCRPCDFDLGPSPHYACRMCRSKSKDVEDACKAKSPTVEVWPRSRRHHRDAIPAQDPDDVNPQQMDSPQSTNDEAERPYRNVHSSRTTQAVPGPVIATEELDQGINSDGNSSPPSTVNPGHTDQAYLDLAVPNFMSTPAGKSQAVSPSQISPESEESNIRKKSVGYSSGRKDDYFNDYEAEEEEFQPTNGIRPLHRYLDRERLMDDEELIQDEDHLMLEDEEELPDYQYDDNPRQSVTANGHSNSKNAYLHTDDSSVNSELDIDDPDDSTRARLPETWLPPKPTYLNEAPMYSKLSMTDDLYKRYSDTPEEVERGQWERRKDRIINLLRGKKLPDVVSILAQEGFEKSITEYEYYLKNWGYASEVPVSPEGQYYFSRQNQGRPYYDIKAYESHNNGIQEDTGREGLPLHTLEERFARASLVAYKKLEQASPSQSKAFQRFFKSLGTHETVIYRGSCSLNTYLQHETVSSLVDVYSFLHIAYAMSQTQSEQPSRSTPAQFLFGIGTFKACLSDARPNRPSENEEEERSDREIFDEIMEVMWDEIDYAVAWIGDALDWRNTSTKMQGLEIAREMLKKAALNDSNTCLEPDPDPDIHLGEITEWAYYKPTYMREQRELEIQNGHDPDELHGYPNFQPISPAEMAFRDGWYRHIARTNPPGKPTWLNIVTGPTFFIVVGFLRTWQKSSDGGGLFPTIPTSSSPYAFSYHPTPEWKTQAATTGEFVLPQWRDRQEKLFIGSLYYPILEHIVGPMEDSRVKILLRISLVLVKNGIIETLRHFENYVLAFRKMLSGTEVEDFAFVSEFLMRCWKCSESMKTNNPDTRRIKPPSDPEYSEEQVERRKLEEFGTYFTSPGTSEGLTPSANDASPSVLQEVSTSSSITTFPNNPPEMSSSTMQEIEDAHTNMSDNTSQMEIDDPEPEQITPTSSEDQTPPGLPSGISSLPALRCGIGGCGYTTPHMANLNRHKDSVHPPNNHRKIYKCRIYGCKSKFTGRIDNLYRHERIKHGALRRKEVKEK